MFAKPIKEIAMISPLVKVQREDFDLQAEITRIARLAIERFELLSLTAIHRYGKISPGENIVLVIAAAPHRQAAFDGANFVMDFLKTSAPFWKKEHGKDGTEGGWVSAKDADDAARAKWAGNT